MKGSDMNTTNQNSVIKCGTTVMVNRGAYADLLVFTNKAGANSAYDHLKAQVN